MSYPVGGIPQFQKNWLKISFVVYSSLRTTAVVIVLERWTDAPGHDDQCFKMHKLMLQIHKGRLDLSLDARCGSSEGKKEKSIKKGQISLLHSARDVCDKAKCQQKYWSHLSAEPADRWEGRGKNVLSCPTRCSFWDLKITAQL